MNPVKQRVKLRLHGTQTPFLLVVHGLHVHAAAASAAGAAAGARIETVIFSLSAVFTYLD